MDAELFSHPSLAIYHRTIFSIQLSYQEAPRENIAEHSRVAADE